MDCPPGLLNGMWCGLLHSTAHVIQVWVATGSHVGNAVFVLGVMLNPNRNGLLFVLTQRSLSVATGLDHNKQLVYRPQSGQASSYLAPSSCTPQQYIAVS